MQSVSSILLFLAIFFVSCRSKFPPQSVYKEITVNVKDFIGDCKSGNSVSGISGNDVNYEVSIFVYVQNGASFATIPAKSYTGIGMVSPSGSNKSVFTKKIEVPADRTFNLVITVDGTECSICNKSYCVVRNDFVSGVYSYVNAGKPYWRYGSTFYNGQIANVVTTVPSIYPRNPNTTPVCDCIIKKG